MSGTNRRCPSQLRRSRIAGFDSRLRCGKQIPKASYRPVNRAMLRCIQGLSMLEECDCDPYSRLTRSRDATHPREFDHRQPEFSVVLSAVARRMYSWRETTCRGREHVSIQFVDGV